MPTWAHVARIDHATKCPGETEPVDIDGRRYFHLVNCDWHDSNGKPLRSVEWRLYSTPFPFVVALWEEDESRRDTSGRHLHRTTSMQVAFEVDATLMDLVSYLPEPVRNALKSRLTQLNPLAREEPQLIGLAAVEKIANKKQPKCWNTVKIRALAKRHDIEVVPADGACGNSRWAVDRKRILAALAYELGNLSNLI